MSIFPCVIGEVFLGSTFSGLPNSDKINKGSLIKKKSQGSMSALTSDDETSRLTTLHRYRILDTPAEQVFDDLTALAAAICETPIALERIRTCS